MNKIELAFMAEKDGDPLSVYDLVPDPEGSGMPWFRETGRVADIEHRKLLGSRKTRYGGKCIDTGVYFSPAGRLAREFLDKAPEGTGLMLFSYTEGVRTRTFKGEAEARYFSEKIEPKAAGD